MTRRIVCQSSLEMSPFCLLGVGRKVNGLCTKGARRSVTSLLYLGRAQPAVGRESRKAGKCLSDKGIEN